MLALLIAFGATKYTEELLHYNTGWTSVRSRTTTCISPRISKLVLIKVTGGRILPLEPPPPPRCFHRWTLYCWLPSAPAPPPVFSRIKWLVQINCSWRNKIYYTNACVHWFYLAWPKFRIALQKGFTVPNDGLRGCRSFEMSHVIWPNLHHTRA